jgi:hypothetical protein
MNPSDCLSIVKSLMLDFADRTGLSTSGKETRRYLWTDAFAVLNFLELYRQTRANEFRQLALTLIDQVHETLGRYRQDDVRRGWISGLTEKEGRRHPTAGGLRIGKPLPERSIDELYDDLSEWDRDGQYFHYLTKWMHALHRTGEVTGDTNYNCLARELAQAAHARFTYTPSSGGSKRMFWKMSIDLSRPQVASMGHHDPLDGLITYYELLGKSQTEDSCPNLKKEINEMINMCRNQDWTTDDPLGLGSLLADACRVGQLTAKGAMTSPELLENIVSSSLEDLESFLQRSPLDLSASHRLAFREFALSIGLKAAAKLNAVMAEHPRSFSITSVARQLEKILQFSVLAPTIEDFWLTPDHRRAGTWIEHRDINDVMLATSLVPEGFLSV